MTEEIEQTDQTAEAPELQAEQDDSTSSEETQAQEKKSGHSGKLGAAAGIAAILFKFKALIAIALGKMKFLWVAFEFLKLGKILTTFGSMIFTIVIDAMRWGWSFAIGFVLLIFVHEMGHVWALKRKGIDAGAPVFIPFVGAMIAMKEMPHNAKDEAEVGIAGPLLGTAGALICLQFGLFGKAELFMRLAYVGFMLNLFNLLPVLPLDGGRVMAAISPKVWLVGLIGAAVLLVMTHNPILLVLIILSAGRTWHGLKSSQEELDYYKVPKEIRIRMTAMYFGLAGFCAWMLLTLHHPQVF